MLLAKCWDKSKQTRQVVTSFRLLKTRGAKKKVIIYFLLFSSFAFP